LRRHIAMTPPVGRPVPRRDLYLHVANGRRSALGFESSTVQRYKHNSYRGRTESSTLLRPAITFNAGSAEGTSIRCPSRTTKTTDSVIRFVKSWTARIAVGCSGSARLPGDGVLHRSKTCPRTRSCRPAREAKNTCLTSRSHAGPMVTMVSIPWRVHTASIHIQHACSPSSNAPTIQREDSSANGSEQSNI